MREKITPGWYGVIAVLTSWAIMGGLAVFVFKALFNINMLLWVFLAGILAFPWGQILHDLFTFSGQIKHPLRDRAVAVIVGLLLGGFWGWLVVWIMGTQEGFIKTQRHLWVSVLAPAIVAALVALLA